MCPFLICLHHVFHGFLSKKSGRNKRKLYITKLWHNHHNSNGLATLLTFQNDILADTKISALAMQNDAYDFENDAYVFTKRCLCFYQTMRIILVRVVGYISLSGLAVICAQNPFQWLR